MEEMATTGTPEVTGNLKHGEYIVDSPSRYKVWFLYYKCF